MALPRLPAGCGVIEPGIHTMSAERYHADPCEQPSLSASIAHLLVNQTPLHAWSAHPRLNPGFAREEKAQFDLGTVAHSLILEGNDDKVRVLDFPDWRKKDAQEERDAARRKGMIPLLEKDWIRVQAMVAGVRLQLEARDDDPPLFSNGQAEQTLVWEERGVWCRARLDWLHDDFSAIDDLKTTGGSANPPEWSKKTLWSIGADVQVAFYLRGIQRLTGRRPFFRYAVIEAQQPHALSVVSLDESALALGRSKVDHAIKTWRECLKTNHWPGYPQPVYFAESTSWEEARWMERHGEALAA